MSKALSIALGLLIAVMAVPAAQADPSAIDRLIAQEAAKGVVLEPAPRTAVQQIIAQERGRHSDARLFGPSTLAPVQIVGPPDGFDLGDAGIGGAAGLALALLAAAALAFRNSGRRQRAAGVASAGS